MSHLPLRPVYSILLALSLFSFGCGSGRQLQSVALTPATADAKNFANGIVPFTATGTFNKPPSPQPLTSSDVLWCAGSGGICDGNINPGVTLDQSGRAQCEAGFSGTVTILAGEATPAPGPDGGPHLKVFGAAQLTCP